MVCACSRVLQLTQFCLQCSTKSLLSVDCAIDTILSTVQHRISAVHGLHSCTLQLVTQYSTCFRRVISCSTVLQGNQSKACLQVPTYLRLTQCSPHLRCSSSLSSRTAALLTCLVLQWIACLAPRPLTISCMACMEAQVCVADLLEMLALLCTYTVEASVSIDLSHKPSRDAI